MYIFLHISRHGGQLIREETMLLVDTIVKVYIFHNHQELFVMRKEKISGWKLRL